jgi:clan AA aspartic protease
VRGEVDEAGRALLPLSIRPVSGSEPVDLVVWVDTAFDGELVIPLDAIHDLELPHSAAIQATLADGTVVVLDTFECEIKWFGQWRRVEVIANEGRLPLLGVGLLRGRKLTVDYQANDLELE